MQKSSSNNAEQLEMFPLFDMDAIKAGVRTNRRTSSLKNMSSEAALTPDKELIADTLHYSYTFEDFDFAEANIIRHEFEDCTFKNCHFVKAVLSECCFTDCTFESCEFVVPKLECTQFCGTKFKGCKLMGMDFSDCSEAMFSPVFDDSLLSSCNFEGNNLKFVPFLDCKIRDTTFCYCNLESGRYDRTEFERTTFQDCIFEKADFTDAHGYEIDPYSNKIKGGLFSLPDAQSFLWFLGIKIE